MKTKSVFAACCFIFCSSVIYSQVNQMPVKDHPRLFLFKNDEEGIKQAMAVNNQYKGIVGAIQAEAVKMLSLPVLERKQIGRRLLSVSREALRRIWYLAYAYRITGNKMFSGRAIAEMRNIATFSDWNPSHFLDVAEMATAMAVGYDWLYHAMSPGERNSIKTAILEKGLKPSLINKNSAWLKSNNNWNQVCNAGMALGALAIYEDEPELAKNLINRAIESITIPMEAYGPDGAYPEGSGYWEYGTTYNVLFLSAIEKIYKTDFGLAKIEGFMNSAGYLLHIIGPTGNAFNYADNGTGKPFNPAVFWFAAKANSAQVLRNQFLFIENTDPALLVSNRYLPMLLIWWKNIAHYKKEVPQQLMWVGNGLSPVALMRTSWADPDAIFLSFKAGSANVNHAHMDVGSFVMEAIGLRWAMDLGMQNYESLEAKGMSIFGKSQNAQRWTIFRYVNTSHNTLTVNDSLHRINGKAEINRYSSNPFFMFAQSDITSVFGNSVNKALRGVAIRDKKYVIVQDEIETGNEPANLRWSMVTPASARIIAHDEILLTQGGQELLLKVQSSSPFTLKTWSTAPTTSYDAKNPGTIIVGFVASLNANTATTFTVSMVPGKAGVHVKAIPLKEWQ